MYILLTGLALLVVVALWRRPRHPGYGVHLNHDKSTEPGLGWMERFLGGSPKAEGEQIKTMNEQIRRVSTRNKINNKLSKPIRALHGLIHIGVKNAVFKPCNDVPAQLQVGFLKPGLECPTTLRYSNASGAIQPDSARDLRGLVARIEVPGVGSYDLLGTNAEASHARDAWQFMQFATAAAGFAIPWMPTRLMKIINKVQFIPNLLWRVGVREGIRMLKTGAGQTSRRVASLAFETFYSRSPYSYNGYALRFRLVGMGDSLCTQEELEKRIQSVEALDNPVLAANADIPEDERRLRTDLIERLKHGPLVVAVELELYTDDENTPLEDGSIKWKVTKRIVAGHIHIPQQDLTTPEAQAVLAEVDEMEFSPWKVKADVRPLGSLNRARKPVYWTSQSLRKGRQTYKLQSLFMRIIHFLFCKKKGTVTMSQDNPNAGGCPMHRRPTDAAPPSDSNPQAAAGPASEGGNEPVNPPSGCPMHRKAAEAGTPPEVKTPVDTGPPATATGPADGTPEDDSQFRPVSPKVGVGPAKYVYWNMFYAVLQWFNLKLAFNKYRRVSWDKWPPFIALFYLLAKIRFNRSNALTSPYAYKTNDVMPKGTPVPERAKIGYTADGTFAADHTDPKMGAENTRLGNNMPPRLVRPDVENMSPSARVVGKLRWRRLDENGKEVTIYALILSDLGGWWIQFQFHNFGGNTKRNPISSCPHYLGREPKEGWPDNRAVVDRTTKDPTRVTDNGRPTVISERLMVWTQAQIYGTNEAEQNPLRTYAGGKMRLDEDGLLPEDPNRPGLDQTGFSNNYNPGLSLLHWLFVSEHNAICDYYHHFHPEWNDETLFVMAQKVNVAHMARIHTTEWTEDLLQHPALQLGMHADWYGFLGQKLKMWIMRLCHRNKTAARLLRPLRNSDTIYGMPGSKHEHHDGEFQTPQQFRMVYRLHELILGEQELCKPGTNERLTKIDLIDFVHTNTRPIVKKFGYEALAWSFMKKSCGALTLHNFPRVLTQFRNQQNGELTDLAELDIFRERTDGTGSYNDFRESLGEPRVTSFMELTGGNQALADELERCYEGDVDKVDAGIGILAEPKPAGFALGFCQFYQFVLNAPRRVKSNIHLTEKFDYDNYLEGMNWVEHSGGILGVIARHLPGMKPALEGNERGFAPLKEAEFFPKRQLAKTKESTGNVAKSDIRTWGLGAVTALAAVCTGAVSWWFAALLLVALAAIPTWLTVRRMLAMRFMQQCWNLCYTDKRGFMFGTLERAEHSLNRAAFFGRMQAYAVMGIGGLLALTFAGTHPWIAAMLGVVAFTGIFTRKWSNRFASEAHILMVSLRNRMRVGEPVISYNDLPGVTTSDKRSHFSQEGTDFCPWLHKDNGEVNMREFEDMFLKFAPGRDYMTAYDFARLHEETALRGECGNWFTRWLEQRANTRKTNYLIQVFADRVVEEDRQLVPAISKSMVLDILQGVAQANIAREEAEGDTDPSAYKS
ncbi:MAG: catalase [Candidatus Obscuribacterales bacterium]|nr:catalase [Candidatus Obscuribacterales bacterium]